MPDSAHPPEWQRLMQVWPRTHSDQDMAGLRDVPAFGDNPGNLRMLTLLPDDLPNAAPLVVVLHGCTQTAAGYARHAGWVELAQRHRFALLLPEQQRANNANLCFNWFEPGDIARGQGEVASMAAMVRHLLQNHSLDPRRVFITGLSAGGAMAGAMLATFPEMFAGGAIMAGLPYGCATSVQEAFDAMHHDRTLPARSRGERVRRASAHRGPWPPVAVWHGAADATVAPANAREIIKQWLDVHGLAEARPAEDRVDGVPHRVWHDGAGAVCVEAYAIPGMDHGTAIAPRAADAQQRCGSVAPFVLDVGIASSWRMAARWGLLRAAAEQRSAPTQPTPVTREAARPAPALDLHAGFPRTLADPKAVIDKALRAARLLKGH